MNRAVPQAQLSDQAALRLICLPYAGGGAASYYRWRSEFPAAIDIVPLSLPGHDGRLNETPVKDLRELVALLVDELTEHALDRPYALAGHSMGAWIAFEMARTLRRRKLRMPSVLIVAASRPPDSVTVSERLHQLPDDKLVATVDGRYGGIPSAIRRQPAVLRLLLPVLRADLEMIENYCYVEEPPLDVEVLALGGTGDPAVAPAQLADWRRHTTRVFSVRLFPGGHFFLFQGNGPTAGGSQSSLATSAPSAVVARLTRLIGHATMKCK